MCIYKCYIFYYIYKNNVVEFVYIGTVSATQKSIQW